MDILMKHEINKHIFWEEDLDLELGESIVDILVPRSSLQKADISVIQYIKQITKESDVFKAPQLRRVRPRHLEGSQPDSDDTDGTESESLVETEATFGADEFKVGGKRKRGSTVRELEEKKWERLLHNLYYSMRNMLLEQVDMESNESRKAGGSSSSPKLPFHDLPEKRFWSSEFSNASMADPTDARKPDLVLLDYGLKNSEKTWVHVLTGIELTSSDLSKDRSIPLFLGVTTKGYLILREQPWRRFVILFSISNHNLRAHYFDRSGLIISEPIDIDANAVRFVDVVNTMTLAGKSSLGLDPTIHICNHCKTHDIIGMPAEAIGWVTDDEEKVYWIMEIMWKSRGLICRGTVCYRVQDGSGKEYALKDCWIQEDRRNHEVAVLKRVRDVPHVARLEKYWDVMYEGKIDCTSAIRRHCNATGSSVVFVNKYHRRVLLSPCGSRLTTFKSPTQLAKVFRYLVAAHQEMVTDKKVLHGDLSPNNLIIHEGDGYFIDFDHAQILGEDTTAAPSHGTGTLPYMSFRVLDLISHKTEFVQTACDDLESMFYILLEFTTKYVGPNGILASADSLGKRPAAIQIWERAYEDMSTNGLVTCAMIKKIFLVYDDPNEDVGLTPYFVDFGPVLKEWRKLISTATKASRDVTHEEVLKILTLPEPDDSHHEDLQVEMTASSQVAAAPSLVAAAEPELPLAIRRPRRTKHK